MQTPEPTVTSQSTRPHFLRLPAELRNKIYEYALTEEDRLIFREDGNGVGTLCLTEPISHQEIKPESDTGLPSKHRKLNCIEAFQEANQLKYVNRQLYQETRGLVLRYNDILVHSKDDDDLDRQLSTLLDSIPQDEKARIKILSLRLDKPAVPTPRQIDNPLKRFFAGQPYAHVLLKVYLSGFSQYDVRFIVHILFFFLAIKKEWYLAKKLAGKDEELEDKILQLMNSKRGLMENVDLRSNLHQHVRIFPWDLTFDEQEFRDRMKDGGVEGTLVREHGGIEQWIPVVREIYEEGFKTKAVGVEM